MLNPKLTRRKFLYAGAMGVAGLCALGADGLIESTEPHVVRVEIALARLPKSFDGFTIAQLSDFHYHDELSVIPIRKSVRLVNQLGPDLIVLTGDFVTVPTIRTAGWRQAVGNSIEPCAELLSQMRAPYGSFAVLGNHDAESAPTRISAALVGRQVPVLRNRSVPLERGGDRVWLVGVDDALRGRPDLGAAIKNVPGREPKILLAHEPDFADESALQSIDLQLSGHSHGGQIWIPGIGAPWLPYLARKYPRGVYRVGNLVLYTNIGIGTIRVPLRIYCQPEVTLITLRAAASGD